MIINWIGNLSQGNGYSGSSENLAIALDNHSDVRLMTSLSTDVQDIRLHTSKNNRFNKLHPIYHKPFKLAETGVFYGLPVGFDSLFLNKNKVGFTMFETSKLPNGINSIDGNSYTGASGSIKDAINNNCDLLLVPCEHNKRLFKQSGVNIPIEVLHLGVDPEMYSYYERPERDTFTFLITGTITNRKNPWSLIKAFLTLFGDNNNVQLVIKTKEGTFPQISNDNITIIDKFVTTEELKKIYQDADAFVFPSRGEGFGLPPLEAMATGLPTIISNHTGMAEYANEKYNYPINKYSMIKADNFPKEWGDVGSYYNPDFNELKTLMKYIYDNREEAKEKGKLASKWVHKYWTYDNSAKRLLTILDKYF